jgi:hypothetical protein
MAGRPSTVLSPRSTAKLRTRAPCGTRSRYSTGTARSEPLKKRCSTTVSARSPRTTTWTRSSLRLSALGRFARVGACPQARRAARVAGSHALRRGGAAGPVVPDARGANGEGARALQRLALRELPLPRTLPIRHLPAHGDDACARGASRHVALDFQGRVTDAHARVGAHIDRALLVAPARDKHPSALHAGPTVGEAHPRVAREAQREAEVGVHERAAVGGGLDGGSDVDAPVADEGGGAHAHARVEHLHRRAGGGAGGEGLGARPAGERGDGERAEEQSQGGVHRATSVAGAAAVSARGESVVPAASKRNTLWSGSKRSR